MFDSIPNFTDRPTQGALADRGFQTGEPVEIKVDFKLTWFELKRQQILKALYAEPTKALPCCGR